MAKAFNYGVFVPMTQILSSAHRILRNTLCQEATACGLCTKPSRRLNPHPGSRHSSRNQNIQTVPSRKFPYHSSLTSTNHHILHTSDGLQRAIPEEPVLSLRHPPVPRTSLSSISYLCCRSVTVVSLLTRKILLGAKRQATNFDLQDGKLTGHNFKSILER